MGSFRDLKETLNRIDGRGYKAYKDIVGGYRDEPTQLSIDYVQGDPFAAPSRIRVRCDRGDLGVPLALSDTPVRRMALADYLTRCIADELRGASRPGRGSGKSGLVAIDAGGQEVLIRTALVVEHDWIEARLEVGLPAAGRRVLGRQAAELLCDEVPTAVTAALTWQGVKIEVAEKFVKCIENQEALRDQLDSHGLVAFVGNGSILPRRSGVDQKPLSSKVAVPFESPKGLEVALTVPHPIRGGATEVLGLGVPKGVTLIVGGGYHGKSTLLQAIERGIFPHIPGDGREYVVTSPKAVKIRAEDGRRIAGVDISPFIADLPFGQDTLSFSTDDASGSTSQAANIVEAIEAGAAVLLVDEDTSATNFMVRDARMQALVNKESEPITPFVDRVGELYRSQGISSVLVMGGCGDYFDVADTVIMMKEYHPLEVTAEARQIARDFPTRRSHEEVPVATTPRARVPQRTSIDASRGRREVKIAVKSRGTVQFGSEFLDLSQVEQLVEVSQTRAVGHALVLARDRFMDGQGTLREVLDRLEEFFETEGLDALDPHYRPGCHPGNFAYPRRFEIAAALNRLRSLAVAQRSEG